MSKPLSVGDVYLRMERIQALYSEHACLFREAVRDRDYERAENAVASLADVGKSIQKLLEPATMALKAARTSGE